MCVKIAGYSYGHADIVRRAMSKKKASVMEQERSEFIKGALNNGISEPVANELFEEMLGFAKYAFNKSHAVAYAVIAYRTAYLKVKYPKEYYASLITSVLGNISKTNEYIDECEKLLHEGDFIFEDDALTDQPEKQIAAEIIREKILRLCDDEIPHGCAVVIEEFKEGRDLIRIRAEIFCERDSHKGILIGKAGETLKKIGSYAREDMEGFFGVKVYLNLWVKVKENWRDTPGLINQFGYKKDDVN